jgi:hypothetical protein
MPTPEEIDIQRIEIRLDEIEQARQLINREIDRIDSLPRCSKETREQRDYLIIDDAELLSEQRSLTSQLEEMRG